VQNNKTGILTEDGIAAFAEGLKKLMNNKDLRIKLGAAAKESMKKYEDVKIWDKWEMLINKVAGEK
jgi:glycosyltransferase involved in cell wall biosynthesis